LIVAWRYPEDGPDRLDEAREVRKLSRVTNPADLKPDRISAPHGFYAASLYDLLRDVQANLENKPPNLEGALARIRELLDGERPAA
jgi:hypothetical protein